LGIDAAPGASEFPQEHQRQLGLQTLPQFLAKQGQRAIRAVVSEFVRCGRVVGGESGRRPVTRPLSGLSATFRGVLRIHARAPLTPSSCSSLRAFAEAVSDTVRGGDRAHVVALS
jgi:hypothetical protein